MSSGQKLVVFVSALMSFFCMWAISHQAQEQRSEIASLRTQLATQEQYQQELRSLTCSSCGARLLIRPMPKFPQ